MGVHVVAGTDSSSVILSAAKNLCVADEILRCAQNDRHGGTGIVTLVSSPWLRCHACIAESRLCHSTVA